MLQRYVEAVCDRKPLIEMVDVLRRIVRLHDGQALKRDGVLERCRLPRLSRTADRRKRKSVAGSRTVSGWGRRSLCTGRS